VPGCFGAAVMTMTAEQQRSVAQISILGCDIQVVGALYRKYNILILLQKKGNAAL
jgi:hypothetical protein